MLRRKSSCEPRSLDVLQAFVIGFQVGQQGSKDLEFFTEWVAADYGVLAESRNSFSMILEHVGGDLQKGFDEFYRLLPMYLRDKEELGWRGILSKFSTVQQECMEAFHRRLEQQHES